MSLYRETAGPLRDDPAGYLRTAYDRLSHRAERADLAHAAAVGFHDAISERARALPPAHGAARAAQDWMIANLYREAEAELDRVAADYAWIDAEFRVIDQLAADYDIDLDDDLDDAGHA